jgi:formylmethanofuran dehydrogenase subunit E
MYDMGITTVTWEPPVKKPKTKTPKCEKCGKILKGKVPFDSTGIVCYFCANPLEGEEEKDTNWKDKR